MAEDDTYTEDGGNTETSDDYGLDDQPLQGESVTEKPTMDGLFDTKGNINAIEKSFKGYIERDSRWVKVNEEIARDSFIDKMVNGLRAIINQVNLYGYHTQDEGKMILWEENEKFIKACVDEPSVEVEDMRMMIEMYDHALETFMGHMIKGHGSNVIRDIFAGLSQGLTKKEGSTGVMDNIKNMFNFGGN